MLALKGGMAEEDKGKRTHTQLHTFLLATLQLHPPSLSDKAAEEVSGKNMRAFKATDVDALMVSPSAPIAQSHPLRGCEQ